jgi:hypothetical protein
MSRAVFIVICVAVIFAAFLTVFIMRTKTADGYTKDGNIKGKYVRTFFTESDEVILNPFMGFMPWAASLNPEWVPNPEVTLAFALLPWNELEPEKGVFDFESFEQRIHFGHLKANNIRLVLRFIADEPSTHEPFKTIPAWLYEGMGGAGVHYEHNYGTHIVHGFAPDYSNEFFIERHEIAINALAERYDASPHVAFVQLGSLGQWGEWHNWLVPDRFFPCTDITEIYVNHYLNAFQHTFIQMRRPFPITLENNIGFFNDMVGIEYSTRQWLGWINNDGLNERYRTAPVGGEIASSYPIHYYFTHMFDYVKQSVIDSNMTFLGIHPPQDAQLQENINTLRRLIGYRFVVREARFLHRQPRGNPVNIQFSIENVGIAPFYYANWDFHIIVKCAKGKPSQIINTGRSAEEIMPNSTVNFEITADLKLPAGEYTLHLAILDPHTGRAGVQFANVEDNGSRMLLLGQINYV